MRSLVLAGLLLTACVSSAPPSAPPARAAPAQSAASAPSAAPVASVAPQPSEPPVPPGCEGSDIDLTAALTWVDARKNVQCGVELDAPMDRFPWPEPLRASSVLDRESVKSEGTVRLDITFTNTAAHSVTLTVPTYGVSGSWGFEDGVARGGTSSFMVEAIDEKGTSINAGAIGIGRRGGGFLDTGNETKHVARVRVAPAGKVRAVAFWKAVSFKKVSQDGHVFLTPASLEQGRYSLKVHALHMITDFPAQPILVTR